MTSAQVDTRTLSGAIHRNCRCPSCYEGHAAAVRSRRLGVADGTWQPWTHDLQAVRAHLDYLHSEGLSWTQISRLAGVHRDRVHMVRTTQTFVRPSLVKALLAVRPAFFNIPAGARIPCEGTRRRVRALRAIGWPGTALAAQSGLAVRTLTKILTDGLVNVRTARQIAELYDHLHDQDPALYGIDPMVIRRGIRHARRKKWAVPLAWTDIDTDENPNRTISRMGYQAAPAQRTHAEVVEETEYLAGFGLSRDQVAERMDLQWASVVAAHRRAGIEVPLRLRMENASEGAGPNRAGDP